MNRTGYTSRSIQENKRQIIIRQGVYHALLTLLLTLSAMFLIICSDEGYETIRNKWYWLGMIMFSLSIVVINFRKKIDYIGLGVGLGTMAAIIIYAAVRGFMASPDLAKWYIPESLAYGCYAYLAVSSFRAKGIRMPGKSTIPQIIIGAILLIAVIQKRDNSSLCGTLILGILLCFVKIDIKKLRTWIYCFLAGNYLAFVILFTRSIVTVPYTGGRYYGRFTTLCEMGFMTGVALIVCLVYFVMEFIKNNNKIKLLPALITVGTIIPAIAANIMVETRDSLAAIAIIAYLVILYLSFSKRKIWPIFTITAMGIGAVVVFCILTSKLHSVFYTPEMQEYVVSHKMIGARLEWWNDVGERFTNRSTIVGIIEDGSFWNIVDRILSFRLSYWIYYFERLNWFGHDGIAIYEGIETDLVLFQYFVHPHNNYIAFLYYSGILEGGCLCLVILAGLVKSLLETVRQRKKDTKIIAIFVFLLMVTSSALFFGEVLMFNNYITMVSFTVCMAVWALDDKTGDKGV